MKTYDAIVVGLGGMGTAITYNLASHGVKTLGLEKFSLNHTNGSSHGKTRIIRTAYFEHPAYVPLVKRAMELWFELQKQSGMNLIKITGGAMIGERESKLISGSVDSARQHDIQTVFWFKPQEDGLFTPDKMPIFMWQTRGRYFYGVPDLGEGVKVAQHHGGRYTTPEAVDRRITKKDEMSVRTFLETRMPMVGGPVISSATCLYTNAPDERFMIGSHPEYRNVIVVSPCSGHGFKFASAIGEVVRELVVDGKTTQDISLFNVDRFARSS